MNSRAMHRVTLGLVLQVMLFGIVGHILGEETSEAGKNTMSDRQTDLRSLPVKYVRLRTGEFAPAYVDATGGVLYVWRGILLKAEQVPNAGPHHRTPVVDLSNTSLDVLQVEPEIRYAVTDDGVVGIGYYDRSSKTFYQWEGLHLAKDANIPEAYRTLRIGTKQGEEVRRRIEIAIPDKFWSELLGEAQ